MTETEKAYIAGLVDGEGCICLHRNHFKDRKTTLYCPRVSIVNTDRDIMDWLILTIGDGKVFSRKRGQWKRGHDWYINGKKCGAFLTEILPYLRIKRLKAELVIQYCNTLLERTNCVKGRKLSPEVIDFREGVVRKLRCGTTNLP